MKRVLICALLAILCLTACGVPLQTSEKVVSEEPVAVGELAMPVFASVEELRQVLESDVWPDDGRAYDVAEMEAITAFYVPQRLPEGYALGFIEVGPSQISFYCFPAEAAGDHMARQSAMTAGEMFCFVTYRWELDDPLGGIKQQRTLREENGLWLDPGESACYWVLNGTALCVDFPAGWEMSYENTAPYTEVEMVEFFAEK